MAIYTADDVMGGLDDTSPAPGTAPLLIQSATPATIIITPERCQGGELERLGRNGEGL